MFMVMVCCVYFGPVVCVQGLWSVKVLGFYVLGVYVYVQGLQRRREGAILNDIQYLSNL